MYPIETQDKLFHDGDGISELGTVLPAWWLNQIQAELVAILAAADIDAVKVDQQQVLAAIRKIIKTEAPAPAAATATVAGVIKVLNVLSSTDASSALSAAQGKVLNDKISSIKIPAAADDTAGIIKVINNLNSTDALSALSAAQGKVLAERINFAIPSGAVMYFTHDWAPPGWLKANGAAVSRTTYASLFSVISTRYGGGDGSTTFNLPDLRGIFLRGYDDGRGVDANRGFGSWQESDNKSHQHTGATARDGEHMHTGTTDWAGHHTHPVGKTGGGNGNQAAKSFADSGGELTWSGDHQHTFTTTASGGHAHGFQTDPAGGSESRPKNIALLACIKI